MRVCVRVLFVRRSPLVQPPAEPKVCDNTHIHARTHARTICTQSTHVYYIYACTHTICRYTGKKVSRQSGGYHDLYEQTHNLMYLSRMDWSFMPIRTWMTCVRVCVCVCVCVCDMSLCQCEREAEIRVSTTFSNRPYGHRVTCVCVCDPSQCQCNASPAARQEPAEP